MAMAPFIDPTLLISGVSALLKAIDTWVGYRDSRRAAEAFDREQQAAEKSLQPCRHLFFKPHHFSKW